MSSLDAMLAELGVLAEVRGDYGIRPLDRLTGDELLRAGYAIRLDDRLGCEIPGIDTHCAPLPLDQRVGYVGYALPPTAQELVRCWCGWKFRSSRDIELMLRLGAVLTITEPGVSSDEDIEWALARHGSGRSALSLCVMMPGARAQFREVLRSGLKRVEATVVAFLSDEERAARGWSNLGGFR